MSMMAYIEREASELDNASPRKRFKPTEVEDAHVRELHELILHEGLFSSECSKELCWDNHSVN